MSGKLAYMVTQRGVIVAWDCGTANLHDAAFHDLIADFHDTMVVINRHWLSCSNRRSTQLGALQTRHLKRTHSVGNRVIPVDDDSATSNRTATTRRRSLCPSRLHDGDDQCTRAVGQVAAGRHGVNHLSIARFSV